MDTSSFYEFFDRCVGNWVSERTYHYLSQKAIERSRTEFTIEPLPPAQKTRVLSDNQYLTSAELESLPGFNLGFYTISETGEEVSQNLNLLFVLKLAQAPYLEGDYLRDRL